MLKKGIGNKASKNIGMTLIGIGVSLFTFVFYEAYLSFLNPGFIGSVSKQPQIQLR